MHNMERMNDAISYIEAHLLEEIDPVQVSAIACCPAQQFSRMFAYVTETTLTDYIRQRRLSLAALELRQTRRTVLEIALKYGYDSHAAFTRAFREQHNIPPSAARNATTPLNIVPPFAFHSPTAAEPELTYRIAGGKLKTAGIASISFSSFGPYKFVGKQIRVAPMSNQIAHFWGECFQDGTFDTLFGMEEYLPEAIAHDFAGCQRDFDPTTNTFVYMVGLFLKPGAPVPEGFSEFDIPARTLAVSWIQGEEYELYANAHPLTVAAIKSNGYEVDWEHYFLCEVYTKERFETPKNNGERVYILDVYMPCIKK